ncbi:MAG TPA: lytic transglycosylase domain-containing protein, partial [Polyangia bacterium]|nr:lytic transglycosylase domain-containing protein [Polyangia bacterium]
MVAVLTLAAGLALGCGAPAKGRGGRAKPVPRETARVTDSAKRTDSTVAAEARDATLGRRGEWRLTSEKVQTVAPLVREAARKNDLPEDLVFGIIWVESRFNPEAVSPVGARGLMQLMPQTAKYLAELIGWKGRHDAFEPEFNIAAGSFYIAKLIDQFDGDVDLALAAYNAGPTKIRRWLTGDGLPPVSIEYHTMVQTARIFFSGAARGRTFEAPSTEELDRLGLAILIAGLSGRQFGLEREDDATPF